MIGIIDPALLLPRSEAEICSDIETVIRCCKQRSIRIVGFTEYWKSLWTTFGRPLEYSSGHKAKDALRELRNLVTLDTSQASNTPAEVWVRGFTQLFECTPFDSDWVNRMTSVVVKAAQLDEDVILFTRRYVPRNLTVHQAGHVIIHENTRWVLHINVSGIGHRQILCVYHTRNLSEKWTCRFDYRLPSEQDGGKFPFVPPDEWWKGRVEAVRTVASKPCWIDARQNGWTRPNIPEGAGFHWDVFLTNNEDKENFGLGQVNITQFPSTEPLPGDIHHVPTGKAGRFKQ